MASHEYFAQFNPNRASFFVMSRVSFAHFLLLAVLCLNLPVAQAAKITFAGTQSLVPKTFSLSVSAIDLETGVVLDSIQTEPRGSVNVDCTGRFCIAAAHGSGIAKVRRKPVLREFSGISKGFGLRPFHKADRRVIRLKGQTVSAAAPVQIKTSQNQVGDVSIAAADLTEVRVAVKNDAFQLSGDVANQIVPRDLVGVAITGFTNTPCYDQDNSFVVLESDPKNLAARQLELELVKKKYASSDQPLVDRSKPANVFVKGEVASQGQNATVSIQMENSVGDVIGSTSISVNDGSLIKAVEQASQDLGSQLCPGPKVDVLSASCQLKSCSCGNSSGYQVLLSMTGTAKLPTNGIVYVTIPKNASALQDCGGATVTTFVGSSGALGCQRSSIDQPEIFNWSAQSSTPVPPSCQCPGDGAPQNLTLVATALDRPGLTSVRDDEIRDVVCSKVE